MYVCSKQQDHMIEDVANRAPRLILDDACGVSFDASLHAV